MKAAKLTIANVSLERLRSKMQSKGYSNNTSLRKKEEENCICKIFTAIVNISRTETMKEKITLMKPNNKVTKARYKNIFLDTQTTTANRKCSPYDAQKYIINKTVSSEL